MENTYDGVRDNDATPGRIDAKIVLSIVIQPFSSSNVKIRRLKFLREEKKYNEYH